MSDEFIWLYLISSSFRLLEFAIEVSILLKLCVFNWLLLILSLYNLLLFYINLSKLDYQSLYPSSPILLYSTFNCLIGLFNNASNNGIIPYDEILLDFISNDYTWPCDSTNEASYIAPSFPMKRSFNTMWDFVRNDYNELLIDIFGIIRIYLFLNFYNEILFKILNISCSI